MGGAVAGALAQALVHLLNHMPSTQVVEVVLARQRAFSSVDFEV